MTAEAANRMAFVSFEEIYHKRFSKQPFVFLYIQLIRLYPSMSFNG